MWSCVSDKGNVEFRLMAFEGLNGPKGLNPTQLAPTGMIFWATPQPLNTLLSSLGPALTNSSRVDSRRRRNVGTLAKLRDGYWGGEYEFFGAKIIDVRI